MCLPLSSEGILWTFAVQYRCDEQAVVLVQLFRIPHDKVCRCDELPIHVIGVPDGRGGEFVKVYAVKKEGAELSDAEFRKFLKLHLDNYKRPRDFEFVESLPKNALRKVLKRELRKDAVEKLKKAVAAGTATVRQE